MEEYHVIVTPDAERDLNELDDYITYELHSPDVAIEYIRSIQQAILGLRNQPKRFRLVDDEPWHSRGVHRINSKNFAIFYSVVDECHDVYIQNIIYQKRDMPHILLERNWMCEDNEESF